MGIEHLPSWWTIIAFVGMAIWNVAIWVTEIRQMKCRTKELELIMNDNKKMCDAVLDRIIAKEIEFKSDIQQCYDWGREQVQIRAEYNEARYVNKELYNSQMDTIIDRLDKIDLKLDKIYNGGKYNG